MRAHRTTIAALVAVAFFSVLFSSLGLASARFARILALEPARAAHRPILKGEACASCHTSKHRPPLTGACDNCHSTRDWASLTHRHKDKKLDQGAHIGVACSRCHRKGEIPKTSACSSCHSIYRHKKDPDCALCHNTTSWTVSHKRPKTHPVLKGTHAKATCVDCHTLHTRAKQWACADCHREHTRKFALEKGHADVACVTCHSTRFGQDNLNKVSVRGTNCTSCHGQQHIALTDCASCHDTKAFKPATFSHETTSWPLTGRHKKVGCEKCHEGREWTVTKGTACANCHAVKHAGLTDCANCHTTSGFSPATFDHGKASWPLTGAHRDVRCSRCHAKQQWKTATGTTCVACHKVQHGGLSDCSSCHGTAAFKPSSFKHASVYKLTGAHSRARCSQCHPRKLWTKTAGTTCVACHKVQHGGLSDCSSCHGTVAFKPSSFKHASVYKLTGAHARLDCTKCHAGKSYAKVKGTTCVACHGRKHGLQRDCSRCHTTSAWVPIKTVRHTSSYPLIGQHKYVDCAACHKKVDFSWTPTQCVACHLDKSHGMPDCEKCHTPEDWSIILPHMGGGGSTMGIAR